MKSDTVSTIADALESTIEAFRDGDFGRAEIEAESALAIDFEHSSIQSALKCAVFWKDRIARADSLTTPEGRGDFLLHEWEGFSTRFRFHLDEPFEIGLEAIRSSVFNRAAVAFLEQIDFEEAGHRPDLLLKAAKAYKGNGSFDKALECLEQVLQGRPDDAGALSEMADCFEAVGDSGKARLYFREAFYLNAQAVDLDQLQSSIVRNVSEQLVGSGLVGAELKEWIPVYAVIQGAFNVKRELKPLEVGQLKQGIHALKAELHGSSGTKPLVLAKLLNRYFWLIDHFFSVKEERSKIEDILLNIKLLDERIYELYTH